MVVFVQPLIVITITPNISGFNKPTGCTTTGGQGTWGWMASVSPRPLIAVKPSPVEFNYCLLGKDMAHIPMGVVREYIYLLIGFPVTIDETGVCIDN